MKSLSLGGKPNTQGTCFALDSAIARAMATQNMWAQENHLACQCTHISIHARTFFPTMCNHVLDAIDAPRSSLSSAWGMLKFHHDNFINASQLLFIEDVLIPKSFSSCWLLQCYLDDLAMRMGLKCGHMCLLFKQKTTYGITYGVLFMVIDCGNRFDPQRLSGHTGVLIWLWGLLFWFHLWLHDGHCLTRPTQAKSSHEGKVWDENFTRVALHFSALEPNLQKLYKNTFRQINLK